MKRRDQLADFEWMETRVGSVEETEEREGRGGSPAAGAADELVQLLRKVERLQGENDRLRAATEPAGEGRARPEKGSSAPARTPTLAEVERDHILKVLLDCHWRVKGPEAAADLLGLNPGTLYSRMKKLGIHRDDQK